MIDVNLIGAPAFSVARQGDDLVFTGYNRRMGELTGLSRAAVVGNTPARCLPPAMAEAVTARYRRCFDGRQAIESESYHDLPGGGRWWHVTLTPEIDAAGEATSLLAIATDVTARKAAEREAREAEARMALALEVLDGGFWSVDVATGALEASPRLAALVAGRAPCPERPMSWAEFTAGIHAGDAAVRDLGPMLRGEVDAATVEYGVDGPQGTRWFRSRRRLIRDGSGTPERVMGAVLDVTEQRLQQAKLAREARTDALTGLANRRGFENSADAFLRKAGGQAFGLIVLDLDRFKAVNDVHGHAAGDAVLRELAARLRRIVRPDDVVARLGGDEFAILVADVEGGALPYLAQRLVLAAQQPVATPRGELSVGVSIGMARSVEGDRAISDLAERADRALYDVKLAGRGAWKIAA